MQATRIYVREDEHGVLRVGETRVMLDSVVEGFHSGHTAETIAQQYPALSLKQVYGAIAYKTPEPRLARNWPAQGRHSSRPARHSPL